MIIMNTLTEDFHMHSDMSDGLNNLDQIMIKAEQVIIQEEVSDKGEVIVPEIKGLSELVITDHCDTHYKNHTYQQNHCRPVMERWANTNNDIIVSLGVEADLLNELGDIDDLIQGRKSNFILLSGHRKCYNGDTTKITDAYVNAMIKHGEKIKFIGHPCARYLSEHLDMEVLAKTANHYNIPLEINATNIVNGKTNLKKLKQMINIVDRVYFNSDAHAPNELVYNRQKAIYILSQTPGFKQLAKRLNK